MPNIPLSSADPLVTVDNISVTIHKKPVLKNISFKVFPKEIVSIIGPNGGGKSTLIKAVLGLQPISSGNISKQAGCRIGYVPQKFNLPTHLPLRVKDFLGNLQQTDLPLNLKQRLELETIWTTPVQNLSGGESQRVLLANALKNKPDLLVLDEPMQGLDLDSEEDLYAFLVSIPERLNTAILIISHDIHWVMQGTKRVICINKDLCCQGNPIEIQKHPKFQEIYKSHQMYYQHNHNQHDIANKEQIK